jgi:probable F420-dependent oxidoreductase
VDFGVGYFPTHQGLSPAQIARLAEERGQESLWFAEHTHIPASRETAWPGGGDLPSKYWHTHDLFVALTAAAAATTRLRVASGICLIIQRDPIVTAKEVASIDWLSGGRMEFGVGAGWNLEEMRNHGADPERRFGLMRERVEAMKAIWTQEEASYSGEHVSFERIWSYPKPLQRPHPPVLIGGGGAQVLDRVLRFGDGWLPLHFPGMNTADRIRELNARADRRIDVSVFMPPDARELERMAELGVRRAVCWLPSGGSSIVEPALEAWESAIRDLVGD